MLLQRERLAGTPEVPSERLEIARHSIAPRSAMSRYDERPAAQAVGRLIRREQCLSCS